MKIEELLKLADAGYTPDMVMKLLSLESDDTSAKETQSQPSEPPKTSEEKKEEPDPAPDQKKEEEPDYKKLYEESLKTIEKIQLTNQQTTVNASGNNKSLEDKVRGILTDLLN